MAMVRSKITERDGQIVFQGIEYTVDQWAIKKKAEADVEARQKELAEQRKRPVSIRKEIRLFVWIVIAIITAPFALVLAFSSWLQDLVAGDQFPWEKMRGAVPDLTNGLSSEAFIRKQRDEWDSTPTEEKKDD
jgi:hypothetical protein